MIRGEATTQIIQFDGSIGALSLPASASIAHLKVNGTASVASFAMMSSTTDQTTRIFRSMRSEGQMYGHRWISVPIRVACSTDWRSDGSAWPACGDGTG